MPPKAAGKSKVPKGKDDNPEKGEDNFTKGKGNLTPRSSKVISTPKLSKVKVTPGSSKGKSTPGSSSDVTSEDGKTFKPERSHSLSASALRKKNNMSLTSDEASPLGRQLSYFGTVYKSEDELKMAIINLPDGQREEVVAMHTQKYSTVVETFENRRLSWDSFLDTVPGFNRELFEMNHPDFVEDISQIKAKRDKAGTAMKNILERWENSERGQEFIKEYLNRPKETAQLSAQACLNHISTISKRHSIIETIKLFNHAIYTRARILAFGTTAEKKGLRKKLDIQPQDARSVFEWGGEGSTKAAELLAGSRESDAEIAKVRLGVSWLGVFIPAHEVDEEITLGLHRQTFSDEDEVPTFTSSEISPRIEDVTETPGDGDSSLLRPSQKVPEASKAPNSAVDLTAEVRGFDQLAPETQEFVKNLSKAKGHIVKEELSKAGFNVKREGMAEEFAGTSVAQNWTDTILSYEKDGVELLGFFKRAQKMPVETAAKELSPNIPILPLNTKECYCKISTHLKRRIEHGDPVGVVLITREKLVHTNLLPESVFAPQDPKVMCDFHLRLYADYIGFKTNNVESKDLLAYLRHIDDNKDDLISYRTNRRYMNRFLTGKQAVDFALQHSSLGPLKFAPVKSASEAITIDDYELPDFTADQQLAFQARGYTHRNDLYSCRYFHNTTKKGRHCKGLAEILIEELNMYSYHLRDNRHNKVPGIIRNMIYSISQQCLRMDHGLWLASVALRGDGEFRLVSYPDCIRCIGRKNVAGGYVLADIPEFLNDEKFANNPRTVDFNILSINHDTDNPLLGVRMISGGHQFPELITQSNKSKNKRYFQFAKAKNQKGLLGRYLDKGAEAVAIHDSDYSTIFAKQGCGIKFDSYTNLVIASCNHTAVNKDGILENGVPFTELLTEVISLKPPRTPRFEASSSPSSSSHPFQAACTVTGLGSLSEALAVRLPWTDNAVLCEAARIIALPDAEKKKHIEEHRKLQFKLALAAMTVVKKLEMEYYGEKSYFRHLAANDREQDDPEEDPEIDMVLLQKYCEDGELLSNMPEIYRKLAWDGCLANTSVKPLTRSRRGDHQDSKLAPTGEATDGTVETVSREAGGHGASVEEEDKEEALVDFSRAAGNANDTGVYNSQPNKIDISGSASDEEDDDDDELPKPRRIRIEQVVVLVEDPDEDEAASPRSSLPHFNNSPQHIPRYSAAEREAGFQDMKRMEDVKEREKAEHAELRERAQQQIDVNRAAAAREENLKRQREHLTPAPVASRSSAIPEGGGDGRPAKKVKTSQTNSTKQPADSVSSAQSDVRRSGRNSKPRNPYTT